MFFYIVLLILFFDFCLEEEVDGAMLVRLPFDELRALLPKLKDRVLFTEKRDILIKEGNNTASEQIVGEDILKECNKQTFDICSESQVTTATQDLLDDTPPPPSFNDMDNETIETTSNIDSQANEDEQDLEEQQQKLPLDFQFVSLPEEIQVIVDENELTKLRGHTNHRRILLNFVFQHVVNTYKLLYKIIENASYRFKTNFSFFSS